jgi:hypothetical protein
MTNYIWTDGCGYLNLILPQQAVDDICLGGSDALSLETWQHLADDIPLDNILQVHRDIMGYESDPDNVRQWLVCNAALDCFDCPDFYKEPKPQVLEA